MKIDKIHFEPKKPGGFSLIELVVAILVFSIGIVGIMKMHQASVQSNAYSMQLTQALNVADSELEFLRGLPFTHSSMSIGAHNPPVPVTLMGVPYNVSWVVTPQVGNLARDVNLLVTWQEKAIAHQLNIPVSLTEF